MTAEAEAAQQLQHTQQMMAMQQQKVVTDAAESKAQADRSLGAERMAKIQLDQALNMERISRAEEDRTAGVLNLVKAFKELDSMNIESIRQKMQLLREIEGEQQQREQTIQRESEFQSLQNIQPPPIATQQEPTQQLQQQPQI